MKNAPYKCHVFVCINDRHGKKKSCADGGSVELRKNLKAEIKKIDPSGKVVRVSQSLCLGLCASGPNVLLYPQNILFSNVANDDLEDVVKTVKEIAAA